MASATVETVQKTVTSEVEEEVVQLTLTRQEAMILRGLCGIVAGGDHTYRKFTAQFREAFEAAGIESYGPNYFNGSISGKQLPGTVSPSPIYLSF